MKQINDCFNRHFASKKPLKAKWQVRSHPEKEELLYLFHYHHLVLVYDCGQKKILKEWWEKPTDKRGLESAKSYLQKKYDK